MNPSPHPHSAPAYMQQPAMQEDEIDLLLLLKVLWQAKGRIVLAFLVGSVLAAAFALSMPNIYTSTTRFLPAGSESGSRMAAMMAGVPDFALSAAGIGGAGGKGDLYKSLLESRSLISEVVEKEGLQAYYETEYLVQTRQKLKGRTGVQIGKKDGLITLSVDDEDPAKAQKIGQTYYDALSRLTATLALTTAQQKRVFFEKQLEQAKNRLVSAEESMQRFQTASGAVALTDQAKAAVEQLAQLRAQISAKKIQIQSMRSFAANTNPDLRRAQHELAALEAELSSLESAPGAGSREGSTLLATADIPTTGKGYARELRNLKHAEAMYAMMTRQLEAAKLSEAEEGGNNLQLIDPPDIPELKSKPKRAMMTAVGAMLATLLMCVWVLFREREQWLSDSGSSAGAEATDKSRRRKA